MGQKSFHLILTIYYNIKHQSVLFLNKKNFLKTNLFSFQYCSISIKYLFLKCINLLIQFFFSLKVYLLIYLFIEREEGREKETERNINCLPFAHPQPGTRPSTQECAMSGNQTSNPLVCRPALSPLSPTIQGQFFSSLYG